MTRLFGFLFAVFVISACSSLPTDFASPEANVTQVELTKPTLTDAILLVQVNVANPNSFPVNLDKIDYDLKLNGEKFLSGTLDQKLEIAANADSIIEVPLAIAYKDVFNGAKQFAKSSETNYTFEGKLTSGFWSVPVKREGKIRLPDASALLR